MLVSEEIDIRWNNYTRKWYESRGYIYTKNNELFKCKIEDVQLNSTAKVEVKCDYCGKIHSKVYRDYLKNREIINKDCCSNRSCMVSKSKEVSLLKYGVESYSQTDESIKHNGLLRRTKKEEILNITKTKNIEILNIDDYENDRTRLFIICNNHKERDIQETNFANIKRLKGCCEYSKFDLLSDLKRIDGEDVIKAFVEAGFEPRFKAEDYKNNSQDLPFICSKHKDRGVQYKRYNNLKHNEGCYYCAKERASYKLRLDENKVFKELMSKDLIPIENQKYKNKDGFIFYRCEKHIDTIQYTSYSNFKNSKQCCTYCRAEESLTNLNRKFRSSIAKWRKDSEKNCDYKCILTGEKDYEVHHLYSYNEIIKEALNNLNLELKGIIKDYSGEEIIKIRDEVIKLHNTYPLGVCLSKKVHSLFHILYSKNATIDDFEEFKIRFYNGEFNKLLEEVS